VLPRLLLFAPRQVYVVGEQGIQLELDLRWRSASWGPGEPAASRLRAWAAHVSRTLACVHTHTLCMCAQYCLPVSVQVYVLTWYPDLTGACSALGLAQDDGKKVIDLAPGKYMEHDHDVSSACMYGKPLRRQALPCQH